MKHALIASGVEDSVDDDDHASIETPGRDDLDQVDVLAIRNVELAQHLRADAILRHHEALRRVESVLQRPGDRRLA